MNKIYLVFFSLCVCYFACKKAEKNPSVAIVTNVKFTQSQISSQKVTLNPSGFAPLTASIVISTSIPTRVMLRVVGKNGASSDVVKEFDSVLTNHNIPILGLYAGYNNIVEITLYDANGNNLGSSAINVKTVIASEDLPTIEINSSAFNKMNGMTLVSYFGYKSGSSLQKPFIFDEFGDLRWYLDFTTSTTLNKLFYDDGIERLKNGNLYFGDGSSNAIYEVNMLGEIINSWPLTGFTFHHKVLEITNGNFLVSVSKTGLATVEDFVIEIDRNSKQIVNTWDLRQALQYSRQALTNDIRDWIHVNALAYDASDNTIVVSGRTQCVAKIDQNNKVVWILGAHRGWGIAGDGTDLTTKLLTPLDINEQPITDTAVLNGTLNHPDFEWNWCQHAIKVMPDGDFLLFDNGDERNFIGLGPYSRSVEYRIDKASKTVKQIWTYGKDRGAETYSRIVSDIDFHPGANHMIFSPGAVYFNGRNYGKVIEMDYNSKTICFEATIYPPASYPGPVTFHRTERLDLYP